MTLYFAAIVSVPSGSGEMMMSKNGITPSGLVPSTVNLIELSIKHMWNEIVLVFSICDKNFIHTQVIPWLPLPFIHSIVL